MQLEQEFLHLCGALREHPGVVYTRAERQKHMTVFSLYFRIAKVDLVYSRKWEGIAPPSVLYCRLYLNKNIPVYLHLPEFLGFLGMDDYRACYFPYIDSVEHMSECLDALMSVADSCVSAAQQLADRGEDERLMERWATEDFFLSTKTEEKVSEDPIDWESLAYARRLQEPFLVARHTILDAYEAFRDGEHGKALTLYKKLEKSGISIYEKGLCRFLEDPRNADFAAMPLPCRPSPVYKKSANGDLADLMGVGLLWLIFSGLFSGLLFLINSFLAADTVYFYGVEWWFGFILGVLPAIFGYFFFQRPIRTLLKADNSYLNITKNSKGVLWFAGIVFSAALAGCIWFCIAVPAMSSRYYETYALLYTEEETTERMDYGDVVRVCRISARYNDFGDRVERASYVLILADGRWFDLDCDGSEAYQRELVQRFFPQLEVEYLDSDRDLP